MDGQLRSRWYDGCLYRIGIDRIVGGSFANTIAGYVPDNSTVIDIGCGVGSVVIHLSGKCSHVTGVDLSPRMTAYARKRIGKRSIINADILNISATGLSAGIRRNYDYAVMTQFLHEIPAGVRAQVMRQALGAAREFIIADFIAPFPDTWNGRIMRFFEMLAGKEHYANFRDWIEKGGVDGFLSEFGLRIMEERVFTTGVGKIVKAVR